MTNEEALKLYVDKHGCTIGNYYNDDKHDIMLVETAEKWAKEHPVKTRQSEFIKLFHCESLIGHRGYLEIYPCNIGYKYSDGKFQIRSYTTKLCDGKEECEKCIKRFWLEEIEDD